MQPRMYQILVPTVRRSNGRPYRLRYHRVWDAQVRAISGGLTILPPTKGQWVNPADGELFVERMIPVQVVATPEQMSKIAAMTCQYYDQLAILYWEVSASVTFVTLDESYTIYRGSKA